MKSMMRPIEFVSPLSEVEVRMTLKGLCGSKWDNFPFDGEVDKNSFRLKKNSFGYSRGVSNPILVGDFVGQDQQTKVTISLHPRMTDILGLLVLVLVIIGSAGYGFVSMLDEGLLAAIGAVAVIVGAGIFFLVIANFWLLIVFRHSVVKIKKALGCT